MDTETWHIPPWDVFQSLGDIEDLIYLLKSILYMFNPLDFCQIFF